MQSMIQHNLQVRFLTPAFLGNAEQCGEWRTPPFKALLRQWWRVAVAEEVGHQCDRLREREAALFGAASDGSGQRSAVRMRLDQWKAGTLTTLPAREVGTISLGKASVPASHYLGYGPVDKGARLRTPPAIDARESAQWRIAVLPTAAREQAAFDRALGLIGLYGTIGGRSRNGWGSLVLEGDIPAPKVPTAPWESAMRNRDWAHAVGTDERGPLVWESDPMPHWGQAVKLLAEIRAGMRRAVPNRQALAYPDQKPAMPGWPKEARVPHSLRFKVRARGERLVATVFHIPCRPADELWRKLRQPDQSMVFESFRKAHVYLDRHGQLKRVQQ